MRISKMGWIGAAVVLGSCAAVVASAQADPAQPPRRQGGGRGGFGQGGRFGGAQPLTLSSPLVPVDVLAKELKLTDEQKTAITAARTKMNTDMRALMTPPADGGQVDFQALRPKMTAINEQAAKDIDAALKDDQKTEAVALLKNLSALQAARIPIGVYSDLKLTADQKTKIAALGADIAKDRAAKQKEAADAQAAGDNAKAQEIRTAMRASFGNGQPDEKGVAILTADQKELVTKYIKDHPQQGRPGGFGPGANRAPQP